MNVTGEILDALKPEGGSAIVVAGQTFSGSETAAVQVGATAAFTSVTTPADRPLVKFTGGAKSAATGFTVPAGIYYFELTGFVCDVDVVCYLNGRPSIP